MARTQREEVSSRPEYREARGEQVQGTERRPEGEYLYEYESVGRTDLSGASSHEIREEIDKTRHDMDRTIDELRLRLSSEHFANRLVGSAREMVRDPGQIVDVLRRNPGPTAVTLFGLGWLVFRNTEHEELDQWASEKREQAGRSMRETRGRLSRRASEMSERASEKMRESGQSFGERASSRGRGFGQQASERMSGMGHEASERISGTARRTGDRFGQLMQENPLGIGTIALALGSAFALAMPSTRREDEVLGPARDQLLEETRRRTEPALQRMKQAGSEAVEDVKEAGQQAASDIRHGASEASTELGGTVEETGERLSGQEQQFRKPEEGGGGHFRHTNP